MRTFAIGVSSVLISAGALAFALGSGGTDPADPPPPPVNTEFAGVLLRIDLGADTLAAAGITGEQVAALVAAVEQSHSAATLQSRDEAYIAARVAHDRLRRLVQSGKGTQADVTALREAEESLANATSARESYLAGLRTAALATVTASQTTLVNRIHANRSWGLTAQYLVKDRSEADWVALHEALDAKRINEQDAEEELPASAQSYLAAIDAESEIATAKVNRDSNIAAVQTAWNLAASD
jgi:hypothetical protein